MVPLGLRSGVGQTSFPKHGEHGPSEELAIGVHPLEPGKGFSFYIKRGNPQSLFICGLMEVKEFIYLEYLVECVVPSN